MAIARMPLRTQQFVQGRSRGSDRSRTGRIPKQATSNSTYGAEVRSAKHSLERLDLQRKYICSGKNTILQHEEPNGTIVPVIQGRANITQLTYSKPDVAQRSVQQHLRTGHKGTDLHMPACPPRSHAVAVHQQQLDREASESRWATASRTAAEAASRGAMGGVCKREGCRPAAKGGQHAQIGRKAVECAQLIDKKWMQIGLQK